MKKYIIITLLLAFSAASAQKEVNIWYFGEGAGIDFNFDPPQVLSDNTSFSQLEGVATICDKNGSLLFYTDGRKIWNRNHQVMPNGDNLNGHFSATQAGVIVPIPGNKNQYYVFSVDQFGGPNGLSYSIVDMTLDGGLGDVMPDKKNILLTGNTAEKVSAVVHANGLEVWIITHEIGGKKFHLFKADGASPAYIKSVDGLVDYPTTVDAQGYLKFSPDGKKLAAATTSLSTIEIFDFNDQTGDLTNGILINGNDLDTYGFHGLEFSPDGTKLYATNWGQMSTKWIGNSKLIQFDATQTTKTDIVNSAVEINVNPDPYRYGALQLGPDKRIYMARKAGDFDGSPYLGVINRPNAPGAACNFVLDGFLLAPGTLSQFGLPNFIQSYFIIVNIESNSPICEGEDLMLYTKLPVNNPDIQFEWTGPNGFSSNEKNPIISNATPDNTGEYRLKVSLEGFDDEYDTLQAVVYPAPNLDFPTSHSICSGKGGIQIGGAATSGTPPIIYQWSPATGLSATNIPDPIADPSATTQYTLTATTADGCVETRDVLVEVLPNLRIEGQDYYLLCAGESATLNIDVQTGQSPYSFSWTPADGLSDSSSEDPVAAPAQSTMYSVYVEDALGCDGTFEVEVEVAPAVELDLGDDITTCYGRVFEIGNENHGGSPGFTYQWTPADELSDATAATPTVSPTQSRGYRLTVTDSKGCSDSDSIFIEVVQALVFDSDRNVEICLGNDIIIGSEVEGGAEPVEYLWTPPTGLSDPTAATPAASPEQTTTYIVEVVDADGCRGADTVIVAVNPTPDLTINGESEIEICLGESAFLSANVEGGTPDYVFEWSPADGLDATDQAQVAATPQTSTKYYVRVGDENGCADLDSVNVLVRPLPQPEITPSGYVSQCSCKELFLDAGDGFASYTWSNGETTREIEISRSGTYTVTVVNEFGCANVSEPVEVEYFNPSATVGFERDPYALTPGENAKVRLVLKDSKNLDACDLYDFSATISYNKTMLFALFNDPKCAFDETKCYLAFDGERLQGDSILYEFDFKAVLGDSQSDELNVEAIEWENCVFQTGTVPSECRTDVCEAGGVARLFDYRGSPLKLEIAPNPAENFAEIRFSLAENGYTNLYIANILGGKVADIIDKKMNKGVYAATVDLSTMPAGRYFVILSTPTKTTTKTLEAVK